ncbi:hypothetical protein ZWY2020_036350 [Hordeum vulgare]|nr:hypothetical protein ZWY2020_036350 [Hordeum vulgare]
MEGGGGAKAMAEKQVQECRRMLQKQWKGVLCSEKKTVPPRAVRVAALPYPSCFHGVSVYQYYYGDYASSAGVMAQEAFTFGAANSTKVAFGCGNVNAGYLANNSGMVGLGRGPFSLVSQLGNSKFSYCLTSFLTPAPSRLSFGAMATLDSTNTSDGAPVQSTPFVLNPALSSMYFLSLQGISLGDARLRVDPLAFAINDDGSGGCMIDSGTSIT